MAIFTIFVRKLQKSKYYHAVSLQRSFDSQPIDK